MYIFVVGGREKWTNCRLIGNCVLFRESSEKAEIAHEVLFFYS